MTLRAPASRLGSLAPRLRTGETGATSGFVRTDGLTTTERGYGADWQALRRRILKAEPVCRLCRIARATEVDHIQRFRGVHDPLRLDPSNLRPLCTPCHRSRTAKQATAAGRGRG